MTVLSARARTATKSSRCCWNRTWSGRCAHKTNGRSRVRRHCSATVARIWGEAQRSGPRGMPRPSTCTGGGGMDNARAFALVEAKLDKTLERMRRIIGVNTVVPPGENYDVLVDYLEPQFQSVGFSTQRVTVPPEKVAQIPLPLKGP